MASYCRLIQHLVAMLIVLAPVITYFASAFMLPGSSLQDGLSVVLVCMLYFKWEQYKHAVKLLLRTPINNYYY